MQWILHTSSHYIEHFRQFEKSVCSNLFAVGQPPFQKKSVCLYRNWKKYGFAADPPPQKCVEMASQARVKRGWCGRSLGPDVTGGASPRSQALARREARSGEAGGRRCRGLWPTACRRFRFGSLRSSSAAGWRQGDHLRTNPIKLRPEHQRRHQAHQQKKPASESKLVLSLKNCRQPGNLVMRGEEERVGGERMFCCYCSSDSLCKLITLPT